MTAGIPACEPTRHNPLVETDVPLVRITEDTARIRGQDRRLRLLADHLLLVGELRPPETASDELEPDVELLDDTHVDVGFLEDLLRELELVLARFDGVGAAHHPNL